MATQVGSAISSVLRYYGTHPYLLSPSRRSDCQNQHWRRVRWHPGETRNREQHMNRLIEAMRLDARFALRSLRRRPTFAAVAIGTIALSIGAATAMFSVVDGVIFRSLPYRDADRIVWVWQ